MDENATCSDLSQFSWNDTIISIGNTDFSLNPENELDLLNILTIGVANLIGIPANSYVMYWIRDRDNPSLVDNMIFLDCVANIGALLSVFLNYPKQIWKNVPFCLFTQSFKGFVLTMNRVIPVTIAIYRYILVCQGRDNFDLLN